MCGATSGDDSRTRQRDRGAIRDVRDAATPTCRPSSTTAPPASAPGAATAATGASRGYAARAEAVERALTHERPRRRTRHDGPRGGAHEPNPHRTRRRARRSSRPCSASVRSPDATPAGAVLLSGDAGVGKTRLLTELRDLAVDRGLAGVRRTLPRLRRQRPALPPVLRGARPAGHRPPRRRRAPSPASTPRWPGSSPAGGCSARHEAGDSVGARPGRPVRGRARPARGGRREGPGPPRHRGHALGRPVDPRHAQLPVLPALRRAGRRGGVVPLRRPPPPPPAPHPGRGVVPDPRRRAPPAPASGGARRPHPDPRAAPRPAGRGRRRRHRRPRRGQRVLRRGARRRRVRPGPLGARRAGRRAPGPPRPARRPGPPGRPRGQRRRPPGLPRHAERGVRPRRRTASTRACARPSR